MVKNSLKLLAILAVLVGIIFAANQVTVFASPPAPIDVTGDAKTGAGPYELGGCITGSVKDLKPGYLLNVAVLEAWNSYRTEGLPPMPIYYWALPGGPDDIFSCVAILKILHEGEMLKEFPAYENDQYSKDYPFTKGSAEVCLDTPGGKDGSIYYYDEFKLFSQFPTWVKVAGPFVGGQRACAPVTFSGVYAYYAPEPDKDLAAVTTTTRIIERRGTVDVPRDITTILRPGGLALGGCVTGNVEDLGEGFKAEIALVTSEKDLKPLPEAVGEFYECVLDVQFFDGEKLVEELPKEKGNILICFAVPPDQNGTIHYLNTYFDEKAEWVSVSDPYDTGIACGPVMKSGYYGMVDVQEP